MFSAPLRVLIVTEDADAAADLARRVAAAGCKVSVASGGPGAAEAARRVDPDVVVLGRGCLSFPGRLRALQLNRYSLYLFASAGAEALLQGLNSCAAGVAGWAPHPSGFHGTAAGTVSASPAAMT